MLFSFDDVKGMCMHLYIMYVYVMYLICKLSVLNIGAYTSELGYKPAAWFGLFLISFRIGTCVCTVNLCK